MQKLVSGTRRFILAHNISRSKCLKYIKNLNFNIENRYEYGCEDCPLNDAFDTRHVGCNSFLRSLGGTDGRSCLSEMKEIASALDIIFCKRQIKI